MTGEGTNAAFAPQNAEAFELKKNKRSFGLLIKFNSATPPV